MTDSRFRLFALDLDGTLLHGADTFEGRFLADRAVAACTRAHDAGIRIAVVTARPVSTGLDLVRRLPVDAVAYLNGALIDFDPAHATYASLTAAHAPDDGSQVRIGFPSARAAEVCRMLVARMPGLRCGIVMNDVRYTNFDVSVYWKTQTWRYSDFSADDVPDGTADKIIVFPERAQWDGLRTLVSDDFDVAISEGVMWMLMSPLANKRHAVRLIGERLGVPMARTAAFGDDLIDIPMLQAAGLGVAVANAVPEVLAVADETCPSNDEDGVAQWIDAHLASTRVPAGRDGSDDREPDGGRHGMA